ncbi:ISL3 family transposase [Ligilactobacillus acidipiscis]|uniref:Mobile element protein n=1 Tax=Ligilactobacillus acidipiscis TaxID=89059 RepID=A0A1K1KQW5_9LACO|nr:ISL3 family transposase [Ligilactobacillus acidipiscis]SFV41238.1 Mobile element protein [Ligilactobacillus acidipiscis]
MMSQTDSILNLLNIQDPNIKISACTDFSQAGVHEKLLSATLTYPVERCVNCGSTNLVQNGTRLTKMKLPSLGEQPLRMNLRKQRYLCRTCHHTFSAQTQLAPPRHSITRQAVHEIATLAKNSLPVKTISQAVGISASSVQRILYKDQRALVTPKELPTALSFDEFRSTKNCFSFICIDAKTHDLVDLLPDRLSQTIREYFTNTYTLSERQKVQLVTMDLNAQYQTFVRRLFPNALIVFDRFHLVQLAGRALDHERLRVLKGINDHHDRNYKVLKSNWRLFHLAENQLETSQVKYYRGLNEYTTAQNVVDLGLKNFPQFAENYQTYQTILTFIRNRDRATLQQLVMNYRPNGTEMDTVMRTIQKNYLGIRNACLYDYSNGPLEGINRKIKELKRSCYGFSNLRHFFIRIKLIHA